MDFDHLGTELQQKGYRGADARAGEPGLSDSN